MFNRERAVSRAMATRRYRALHGIDDPLFLGIDTHALSVPACATTLEVLAANGVTVMLAADDGATEPPARPTP